MTEPDGVLGTLRDRTDRRSILAGIVAAVVVAVAALAILLVPAPTWTASSSLLVLPDRRLSPTDAATYYDRSGDAVIATFARVVKSVDAPPPQPGGPSVEVDAVPDTTIITITATASAPDAAVSTADAVAVAAVGTLTRLSTPYVTSVLNPARTSLVRTSGPGAAVSAVVTAAVAVLVGALVQQGVWYLASRRRRPRSDPPDPPDPPADPAAQTAEVVGQAGRLRHRAAPVPPR